MATGGEDYPGGGARKKTFFGTLSRAFKKKGKKAGTEGLLEGGSWDTEIIADDLRRKMSDIRDLINGTEFNQAYQRLKLAIDSTPAQDTAYPILTGAMMKMDQYRSKLDRDIWTLLCELNNMDLSVQQVEQLEPRVERLLKEAHYVHAMLACINAQKFCLEQQWAEQKWFERNKPNEVPQRTIYEFTYLAHPGTMRIDMNKKFDEFMEVAYGFSRDFMKVLRALQACPPFPEQNERLTELSFLQQRFKETDDEVCELIDAMDQITDQLIVADEIEALTEIMVILSQFSKCVGRSYQWNVRLHEIDQIRQQAEMAPAPAPVLPPPPLTPPPLPPPRSQAIPIAGAVARTPTPTRHGSLMNLSQIAQGMANLANRRTMSRTSLHGGAGYKLLTSSERRRGFQLEEEVVTSLPDPNAHLTSPSRPPTPPLPRRTGLTPPRRRRSSNLQFSLSGE